MAGTETSVLIEGKKRRGKRDRRDNPTMRMANPSIIAPTYVEPRDALDIEDYRKKSIPVQEIKTISKHFRSSETSGYSR